MFGSIGMPELILIFVVALLVFGPKKLPELGKSLGKGLAEFKKASEDLKRTIEDEIEQGKQEAEAVKKEVAGVQSTLASSVAEDPRPAEAPRPAEGSVPRTDSPIRPA
jgi:sec-independent protein translocase protein TatA